ncbi:MAG: hypothetical protein J6T27_00710 [Alphaproteobacteria bacterium]|nr:hypothetical protein [Alphaproteobacteria bacterium]
MRSRILSFVAILCGLYAGSAFANWQYNDGYGYPSNDDGSRVSVSFRGGASFAISKIKNEVGSVVYSYCVDPDTGAVFPTDATGGCGSYSNAEYAGTGSLGSLDAERLMEVGFSAGASIGWILPDTPQWRLELGWDHFSKVDYNKSPLFSGNMPLSEGYSVHVDSGSVQSTMTTDIISIMAFYDFFDGLQKPIRTMVPYIGLGFGYADTQTVMNLADPWGDLSEVEDLTNFGTVNGNGVLQFNRSTTNTTNVAGVAALGFSYGINENLFIDFGLRASYLPKVKYTLVNSDDTRRLDWFSAKNLIYANVMFGLRVEF